MTEKTILILSGRHRPIEVTFLVASLLLGIFGLIRPARTVQQLDEMIGFGFLWYIGIAVGAIISLVSLFFKMPLNLLWERIGLVIIATFFLGYSFATTMFFGWPGLQGSILIINFGVGAALRAWQISQDLRLLGKVMKESGR